jgi:hypothetical protein
MADGFYGVAMDGFDSEIERAVNRAGGTALGLNLVAVVLVVLTALAMAGLGNNGASYIEAGSATAAFVAAALLHGLARLVHLNAMQLMEIWRQGSRSDHQ